MSQFQIHTAETAPEESKDIMEKVNEKYGFTPNLIGELAESPAAVKAYTAVADAFSNSSLSPVEQQVVLLTTSFENKCHYCMAAHSTVAGMVEMPEDVLRALRDGEAIASDPKLEALRQFTRRVVTERGWVEDADVQRFLDAGYSRENLLDVLAGVTQKTLSNYANHIAETPVDEQFQPKAWEHPEERRQPVTA